MEPRTNTRTEFRDIPMEVRADPDSGKIVGYAAVFDQEARIWDFDEVIRKGAFSKTIKDGADVFALFDHDTSKVLGRTKNGTLELREDPHGLHVEVTPPDTATAQEVRQLIRDGFVDKMSFGFEVLKQSWTEREGEPDLREIKEVKLYEVSAVPIPAYEGTSVSARGYRPEKPVKSSEQDSQEEAEPSRGSQPTHSLARDEEFANAQRRTWRERELLEKEGVNHG